VKQLTLHENKITNYGLMSTHHTTIEELWIDPNAGYFTKQGIAQLCTNLVAEICEDDTSIQDVHTQVEYSDKSAEICSREFRFGAGTGAVFGILGGVFTPMFCIFYKPCSTAVYGSLSSIGGICLLMFGIPLVCVASCATLCSLEGYCHLKPDERIKKTILKQIAQDPPIIQKLRQ